MWKLIIKNGSFRRFWKYKKKVLKYVAFIFLKRFIIENYMSVFELWKDGVSWIYGNNM